jgi:hypothetical protein
MKVYVVIGLYRGVIDEVEVFADYKRALDRRNDLDQDYGIERDSEGRHEHPENEVELMECEVQS